MAVVQFAKSVQFKNFLNISRLDDIACDAELQEKSESELRKLATTLQTGVEQAIKDAEEMQEDGEKPEGNTGECRLRNFGR